MLQQLKYSIFRCFGACFHVSHRCLRWYIHWALNLSCRKDILTGNAISATDSDKTLSCWPVNQACILLGLLFTYASRTGSVTHTLSSVISATIVVVANSQCCSCSQVASRGEKTAGECSDAWHILSQDHSLSLSLYHTERQFYVHLNFWYSFCVSANSVLTSRFFYFFFSFPHTPQFVMGHRPRNK